jgi:hypothetical protein
VERATKECQRLIGGDAVLWERWVYAFARRRLLRYLAPSIPTCSPRLPPQAYAVVLESLLLSSPRVLHLVVKKWGSVSPPLFDQASLLARIKAHRGGGSVEPRAGRWLLQTEAALLRAGVSSDTASVSAERDASIRARQQRIE